MESFFLEENENIETHVAKEKQNKTNQNKTKKPKQKQKQNKQFVSHIDKNLVSASVQPNEHFGYGMFVSTTRKTTTDHTYLVTISSYKSGVLKLGILRMVIR